MATTEQIIAWMEDGFLNGFAESVIGDLSAGTNFHVYYGWQTESTDELDAVGYWAVVTDYMGNRSLEEFDSREEMEAHQEEMSVKDDEFWFGHLEEDDEPEFVYDDAE